MGKSSKLEKVYILIRAEIGEEISLYNQLLEITELENCLITYGSFDIVAEFVTDSSEKMNMLIASKIRKLNKIKNTITLRIMN